MLVARIEIWPGGDPRPLRQIALLAIVNVGGPDDDGLHSYEARFEGRLARLKHRQSDGPLVLLGLALEALLLDTEPDPLAGDAYGL
jgi:hypothetical protein